MGENPAIVWDGKARGYLPPETLRISPSLRLHTSGAQEVDPITYEVIRNTLMGINFEHGNTIQKLSISPITMITRDFQCTLLTESGEVLCLGPYLLYLGVTLSFGTRWILENRSAEPGIEEGDVFLWNDPYVGTAHQQDTALAGPVFWEGELFCWVANCLHLTDVGGAVSGSFCVGAKNFWEDPPSFPPVKLVERGKLRVDVEDAFVRQSRLPNAVRMDLHAALAGINVARERVLQLVRRYGAATVKGVMYRLLEAAERAFLEKLRHIPDGRWSERVYTEAALPGDERVYVSQVNITKQGDYLVADNEGTSPQIGSINNTLAGFAGAVLLALTLMLGYDLGGACGGLYRRVKFRPVPGTITCADFPAAVSPAGQYNMPMVASTAVGAVAKMVACADDPELRAKALTMVDVHAVGGIIFNGTDRRGDYFVAMNPLLAIGAFPASPARDGIDTGGNYLVPGMEAANVEENELAWPVLTLYRRQSPAGAAGAGRFRGGLGVEEAIVLHGTEAVEMAIYMNESFAKGQGLLGGNPSGRGFFRVKRNSNVWELLADGRVSRSLGEIQGEEVPISFKGPAIILRPGDVWSNNFPNTPGVGDPLDRDPYRVARDVAEGKLTPEEARGVYGVVMASPSEPDLEATASYREEARRRRVDGAGNEEKGGGQTAQPGTGYAVAGGLLRLEDGPAGPVYRCRCGRILGPAKANYKDYCRVNEIPASDIGPAYASSDPGAGTAMRFREFFCPSCGTRLATELARAGDPYLWDIALDCSNFAD
ncbi:MAG: hydantoinase B/oxoprolinase family protein [Clostridia bacterium]|jgi:N-methylhydantoinase B|nr:hydantoinase B/oxoprolinase family protein [Clostridia bacterium]MDH7572740.1 hydantoinase B/oxoprolinase family protein [Clostridia bacterium]